MDHGVGAWVFGVVVEVDPALCSGWRESLGHSAARCPAGHAERSAVLRWADLACVVGHFDFMVCARHRDPYGVAAARGGDAAGPLEHVERSVGTRRGGFTRCCRDHRERCEPDCGSPGEASSLHV